MVVSAFGPGASSSLGRTLAAAAVAGGNATPGPRRGRRPRTLSPSEVSGALSATGRTSPFVGEAPAPNMKDWRDLGSEVCCGGRRRGVVLHLVVPCGKFIAVCGAVEHSARCMAEHM